MLTHLNASSYRGDFRVSEGPRLSKTPPTIDTTSYVAESQNDRQLDARHQRGDCDSLPEGRLGILAGHFSATDSQQNRVGPPRTEGFVSYNVGQNSQLSCRTEGNRVYMSERAVYKFQ